MLEQVLLLNAAAAREEAIARADYGDFQAVEDVLTKEIDVLYCCHASFGSIDIDEEIAALEDLKQDLEKRNVTSLRKKMRGQSYNRHRSKPL